MDNLLHRLDLSVRLLKGEGKHTLAQYIARTAGNASAYTGRGSLSAVYILCPSGIASAL